MRFRREGTHGAGRGSYRDNAQWGAQESALRSWSFNRQVVALCEAVNTTIDDEVSSKTVFNPRQAAASLARERASLVKPEDGIFPPVAWIPPGAEAKSPRERKTLSAQRSQDTGGSAASLTPHHPPIQCEGQLKTPS